MSFGSFFLNDAIRSSVSLGDTISLTPSALLTLKHQSSGLAVATPVLADEGALFRQLPTQPFPATPVSIDSVNGITGSIYYLDYEQIMNRFYCRTYHQKYSRPSLRKRFEGG